MVYFDGHERRDVKADRAEKLVMLQVLEEVCTALHPCLERPPSLAPALSHALSAP